MTQITSADPANTDRLSKRAAEAAALLRLLANEKRLLVLCALAGNGEMSVTELRRAVELGQSALSQHLSKLRRDGLVATRRDAQTIYYRIGDGAVGELLATLHHICCR